jgi:hypothetical protein
MWFDWTNYWVKMVLTLAIFRQLIALKGLWKVFENRQKKSLKVFEFFWSWRLRTLLYVLSKKSMLPLFVTTLRSSMKLSHFLSDFYCKKALQLWITKNARTLARTQHYNCSYRSNVSMIVVVELYLSTLTPSTVADFHGGRVPENYFTCRIW